MKTLTKHVVALVGVSCLAGSVHAQLTYSNLLLYLDARDPGDSPAAQWEDLTTNNQAFVSNGNPVHDAGSGLYTFNYDGLFSGSVSNEALYDFDTEYGAGAGNGDAFTVVFYASVNGNQSRPGMINKQGNSTDFGWNAGLAQDEFGLNNVFTEQRTDDNNVRRIIRVPGSAADPDPNSLNDLGLVATDLNLYVVHFTGIAVGPPDGALVWINGATSNAFSRQFVFAALSGGAVTTNDAPLHIGGQTDHVAGPGGFRGTIQFIEVWEGETLADGMFPDQYSAWRWNGGDPLMLGDPGPTVVTSVVVAASNSVFFTHDSKPGVDYMLQSATDLTAPDWADTGYVFPGTGAPISGTDPEVGAGAKAYRMVER